MFTFKQFTVKQDKCAMKVGTDGVLLGAWCDIKTEDIRILDIGTGTGLIALMLAQRSSSATIDAVEIDKQGAIQAEENVKNSPWANRITIHNADILNYNTSNKYNLIVSNPPFFNNSLTSPNKERSLARHTLTLSFSDLTSTVTRLLSNTGRFTLILPLNESKQFDIECNNKLYLNKKINIRSRANSEIKRVISEYTLSPTEDMVRISEIAIREDYSNEYTEEYCQLTADFYLKF